MYYRYFFFFQAEDGIRDGHVTGVQTCALPISRPRARRPGDLPHRARRHGGQGPRTHPRRRRLRDEALQPGGAGGPDPGRAPQDRRPAAGGGVPAPVRRPRDGRGLARGPQGLHGDRAPAHRVQPPPVPPAEPEAGAVEAADPRPRVALRLRWRVERRGDLHQLPAQEARRRRTPPHPHRPRRGLRAPAAVLMRSSLRTRVLAATLVLVAVGLSVAGVATYTFLRKSLIDRVDDQLRTARFPVLHDLLDEGPGPP